MSPDNNIYEIRLGEIEVRTLSVRHSNVSKGVDGLAASIRRHGLIQPVVLIGTYGVPPYRLIAGQRRFLAHKKLKKATIRCVFESNADDETAILLSLVENLQRLDVNHADGANAVTRLFRLYDGDERQIQRQTGLSLRRIRDYITIESQASSRMKRRLRDQKVTPADVRRALRAASGQIKKAEEILDLMSALPLTPRHKRRVVEYGETHRRASARRIIQEATRPGIEQSMLVSLTDRIRAALKQASAVMEREPEEIVAWVLDDWVERQGLGSKQNER